MLRGRLAKAFGDDVAASVPIQYGGSVKPDNVVELMACPDVDGALVGGASLEFTSFSALVNHRS
jgi:triosephosphate isomerase